MAASEAARPGTAAEAFLALLHRHGVEYLFANPGTDFAPLIEALARAAAVGLPTPQALPIAHETVAMGMAHGFYLATGRPQAVMTHVTVGMANAVMGLLNAARDNVPILFASGRTPLTEQGALGSRDLAIHWGQEMFDQAAMVRECVKWDMELRYPVQIEALIERALAIAMSEPKGPVYLSLPREPLAAALPPGFELGTAAGQRPATPPAPDAGATARAAELLHRARRPVILAAREGGAGRDGAALATFARRIAAPVIEIWPSRLSLPTTDPLHAGFSAAGWIEEADCLLVLDTMVPWQPGRLEPAPGCPVIQIGPDPLFAAIPVRGHRAEIALTSTTGAALAALHAALDRLPQRDLGDRRTRVAARIASARAERLAAADRDRGSPASHAWISRCLDRAKGPETIVVDELGCRPELMTFAQAGTYFGHSLAGGLGWGLPAALGIQLADRRRTVVATVGDGSYLFANPVACHQTAQALGLPVLTIVLRNGRWDTVRRSTASVYPEGQAIRANAFPLASLEPSPAHAEIARACGGWGMAVEDPEALPAALDEAFATVREGRQALLDIRCR